MIFVVFFFSFQELLLCLAIAMADDPYLSDKNIEMWKMKMLIKELEAARGNGTCCMISLIIRPHDDIYRFKLMLKDEIELAKNIRSRVIGTCFLDAVNSAANIRSRVKGTCFIDAANSALQRLEPYCRVPPNGLQLYAGKL